MGGNIDRGTIVRVEILMGNDCPNCNFDRGMIIQVVIHVLIGE